MCVHKHAHVHKDIAVCLYMYTHVCDFYYSELTVQSCRSVTESF